MTLYDESSYCNLIQMIPGWGNNSYEPTMMSTSLVLPYSLMALCATGSGRYGGPRRQRLLDVVANAVNQPKNEV
jgi:hypothetical protein